LSQFTFLESEWPTVFEAAGKAEAAVRVDNPNSSNSQLDKSEHPDIMECGD